MANVRVYSAQEFIDAVEKSGLELVHFASPLFSGCQYVSQIISEISEELEPFVEFSEVNLELNQGDLIHEYEIEQLPTLLLLQNGKILERIESYLDPDELEGIWRDCISFYIPPPKATD